MNDALAWVGTIEICSQALLRYLKLLAVKLNGLKQLSFYAVYAISFIREPPYF